MSNKKNNLKDRFSNFEPEVDESSIDLNWQSFKEKLPLVDDAKSKKVGFFKWSFLLLFTGIISTALIIFYFTNSQKHSNYLVTEALPFSRSQNPSYYSETETHQSPILKLNRNNNSNVTTLSDKTHLLNSSNTNNGKKSSALAAEPIFTEPVNEATNVVVNSQKETASKSESSLNTSEYKTSAAQKSTIIKKKKNSLNSIATTKIKSEPDNINVAQKQSANPIINSVISNGLNKSTVTNSESTPINTPIKQFTNTTVNSDISNSNNESTISNLASRSTHNNELVKETLDSSSLHLSNDSYPNDKIVPIYHFVLPKDTHFVDISTSIIQVKEEDDAKPSQNKLSYELFLGANLAQNKISTTLNSQDSSLNNNKLGFSIGGALNYKLNRKLYITGQFMFAENKITIEKSKTERIDIGYQTHVVFTPTNSAYSVDTTKKYFNYDHHYSLKSLYCYNYSLGLGYQILNKKKLFLDGSILMNLKLSKYNIEKTSHLNPDTISYYSSVYPTMDTTSKTNYNNNAKASAPEVFNSVINYSNVHFGVLANLTLGYNVTEKVALIIKPSYYFDITRDKINISELLLKINQNNLFIHFGVRIKL